MNFIEQYIAKLRPEFQGAGKVAEAYAQLVLERLDRVIANTESDPDVDYGNLYPQFHVPLVTLTATKVLEVPPGETWALTTLCFAGSGQAGTAQVTLDGKPLFEHSQVSLYNKQATPIFIVMRQGTVLTVNMNAGGFTAFAQCKRLTAPRPRRNTHGALGAILRPIQVEGTADDVDQTLERHAQ